MIGTRSKYDLMKPSEVTDTNGNYYPDITSFPINDFTPSVRGRPLNMTESNIYRLDLFIGAYYGSYEFYDLITLWLNDIPYISSDEYLSTDLLLYLKTDIDSFYLDTYNAE